MALKFRLKGLAETFIDSITCPACGISGNDDQHFNTDLTRVTFDGIVVIAQCRQCHEIFVPDTQRLGIIDSVRLREAVTKDCQDTGERLLEDFRAVKQLAQKMNIERKGDLH